MKVSGNPSIALYGTNALSLILGRACALREYSLLEVYESDPQAALKASLYLGVSARSTPEEILASGAKLVFASETPPAGVFKDPSRVLLLLKPSEDSSNEHLTWVDSVEGMELEQELTTISSTPPNLKFRLAGRDRNELADFLNQLSGSFSATSID